eukprot:7337029-Prymnesium_polylepis.1
MELEHQNYQALRPETHWTVPPVGFSGKLWKDDQGVTYKGEWTAGSFFGEVCARRHPGRPRSCDDCRRVGADPRPLGPRVCVASPDRATTTHPPRTRACATAPPRRAGQVAGRQIVDRADCEWPRDRPLRANVGRRHDARVHVRAWRAGGAGRGDAPRRLVAHLCVVDPREWQRCARRCAHACARAQR